MTFIMIRNNFSVLANIDKRKSTKNFFSPPSFAFGLWKIR